MFPYAHVRASTSYPTPLPPLNVSMPFIIQGKKKHLQPNTYGVLNMHFLHPSIITCYHFVVLFYILVYLLFLVFCHRWHYLYVFLFLTKLELS